MQIHVIALSSDIVKDSFDPGDRQVVSVYGSSNRVSLGVLWVFFECVGLGNSIEFD